MKNQKYLLILSSILVITSFASAKPEDPGKGDRPDPAKRFEKLDTNADGALSQDEVKGGMAKRFAEIDTNSDGKLTPDELRAGKPAGTEDGKKQDPGERFTSMDTDGNGSLSLAEVDASGKTKMSEHFAETDTNSDGELSKEELKAVRDKMRSQQEQANGGKKKKSQE